MDEEFESASQTAWADSLIAVCGRCGGLWEDMDICYHCGYRHTVIVYPNKALEMALAYYTGVGKYDGSH